MNQEILKQTADTILDTGVPVTISIRPRNRVDRVLQGLKIRPTEKIFNVQPLCLGALIKISSLILSIDKDLLEGDNMMERAYSAIMSHTEDIIKVIGIALKNNEEDPPNELLDLIRREFTAQDLARTLTVVVEKMNIRSFLISIISVRGLNVLAKKEVSPIDQGSQIASGELLEE